MASKSWLGFDGDLDQGADTDIFISIFCHCGIRATLICSGSYFSGLGGGLHVGQRVNLRQDR